MHYKRTFVWLHLSIELFLEGLWDLISFTHTVWVKTITPHVCSSAQSLLNDALGLFVTFQTTFHKIFHNYFHLFWTVNERTVLYLSHCMCFVITRFHNRNMVYWPFKKKATIYYFIVCEHRDCRAFSVLLVPFLLTTTTFDQYIAVYTEHIVTKCFICFNHCCYVCWKNYVTFN